MIKNLPIAFPKKYQIYNNIMKLILWTLASFLLGSFPSAYLITKKFAHQTITDIGDKNPGTRNVMHQVGKKLE